MTRRLPSSTCMRVKRLEPSTMVTCSTGPGTTSTMPPPRSSTDRKFSTGTSSVASTGTETNRAAANSGTVEGMDDPFFPVERYICSATFAACPARLQPAADRCILLRHDHHHRELRQPLRAQGACVHEPQGHRV